MSYPAISKRVHHHRVHISTSDCTRHTPMHASTVFGRVGDDFYFSRAARLKTCSVRCPRLTFSVLLLLLRRTSTDARFLLTCKAALRLLRKQFHLTLRTSQLVPGAFTPNNGRRGGGVYCVAGEFSHFVLTGAFNTIEAFIHITTVHRNACLRISHLATIPGFLPQPHPKGYTPVVSYDTGK